MSFRLAALAVSAAAANVLAAGFDCARATTQTERTICASPRLAELDEYLARYYSAANGVLKDGAACLRSDQQEWLRRRNACADANCLENAYVDRLAELHPLQPGATALKRELPERPGLTWIIPPAADKVAAPANPKAVPGELHGVLLDEVAGGDGFVVRAKSGERRLVVPLMFLEGETASRLAGMAREADSTFIVRGHVASGGSGKYYEPSRCIFIHRVNAPFEGRILPQSTQSHPGFKPHELAFVTPKDGVARSEFRSVPFHAVILRTAAPCSVKESERREVQALFPAHKVFFPRAGCEDAPEENITYTNVDPKYAFVAVYAGSNEAEARLFLEKVVATGRFPGANLRRMQAVLNYP